MAREKYPNAKILAHPECSVEVTKLADYVGSTSGIMNYAKKSDDKQFVIVTEKGVADRLKRDCSDKEFILIKDSLVCPNMKWNTLEDIYNCLKNETNEIFVDKEISDRAYSCIEKMLNVSNAGVR